MSVDALQWMPRRHAENADRIKTNKGKTEIIEETRRGADRSSYRYRLDHIYGGIEIVVFEYVEAIGEGKSERVCQMNSWFPENFLQSDAPEGARNKLRAMLRCRSTWAAKRRR